MDSQGCKYSPSVPVNIQGLDIEIVKSYKYLGVHLNNKLSLTANTNALYKKGQNRLCLLRRLRSVGVQGILLRTFFDPTAMEWSAGAAAFRLLTEKRLNRERDRKENDG